MPLRTKTTLFFLVTLFLCSWHLDHGHNDNTMARAASVASIVDRGTLEITPIHEVTGDKSVVNGRYYSDKAPLPTYIVLPFHWLAVKLGLVHLGDQGSLNDGLLRLGGFLCGSVPLALLITLAWVDLRGIHRKNDGPLPLNAAFLAALPLFGSFCFVYSGSFFNHLPGALFSVLAARSIYRERYLLAGVWGGAAFLSESVLLLFVAIWGAQQLLEGKWSAAVRIGLGLVPGLVGAAIHNNAVTGNAFVFPNAYAANYSAMHQQYGFGTWQPEAFVGMLISDYRGILFYMPFLIVGLYMVLRALMRTTNNAGTAVWKTILHDPFILPAILLIAAFLTHATWWGGWTYGPRYIMASAVLLTFAILYRIGTGKFERWGTVALCSFGILCALAAKATKSYSLPTGMKHPFTEEIIPHVLHGDWTTAQWPVLLGLPPGMATFLFVPIFVAGLYLLRLIDRS